MACSSSAQPFEKCFNLPFRFQVRESDQLRRFNHMFLFEYTRWGQRTGATRRSGPGWLKREAFNPGEGCVELIARFGFELRDMREAT